MGRLPTREPGQEVCRATSPSALCLLADELEVLVAGDEAALVEEVEVAGGRALGHVGVGPAGHLGPFSP